MCAPVAQLDRVPGYEPGGRGFESCLAHHQDACSKAQAEMLWVFCCLRCVAPLRSRRTFPPWNLSAGRMGEKTSFACPFGAGERGRFFCGRRFCCKIDNRAQMLLKAPASNTRHQKKSGGAPLSCRRQTACLRASGALRSNFCICGFLKLFTKHGLHEGSLKPKGLCARGLFFLSASQIFSYRVRYAPTRRHDRGRAACQSAADEA